MTPDTELLRAFLEKSDEAAFTEIVRRHADLVYSVALRVTRNPALAQDATQTVFTLLTRKARSLLGYDTLVGWLHTTARHAAINAVRGEERRRAREQEASIMQNETSAPALDWEEIGPLLDEAVDSLPAADRKAILLRFFQNRSHQEVGEVLGLGEDTARKRVERALAKLHAYFIRRGITASSAVLAATMVENSVQAAPAGLADSVAGASLAGTGIATEGILLKIIFMSAKTKLVTSTVVIVLIAITLTLAWPPTAKQPVAVNVVSGVESPKPVMPTQPPVPAHGDAVAFLPAPPPAKQSVPAADTETTASIPTGSALAGQEFTAEPKADLKSAILTGMHFLNTRDTLSFFKTLMPPTASGDRGRAASLEAFAKQIDQSPDKWAKLDAMLQALNALQDKTPNLNDEGTRATYHLDPPVAGHKVVIFNKVGDYWYLDGM